MAAELKEEVTCPVCLEMPRSGYLLCANGHLTCRTCHSRLKNKSCPQCRARCSKGEQQPWQSHLATRILERLQNVECLYVSISIIVNEKSKANSYIFFQLCQGGLPQQVRDQE